MKIIMTQQMKELEKNAQKQYSINHRNLMENAGKGAANWIKRFTAVKKLPKRIVVLSGKGNNAGDSFVAVRFLRDFGFDIKLILLAKESDLKGISKLNYSKIKNKRDISIYKADTSSRFEKIKSIFNEEGLILDGIFGTGLSGLVRGFIKEVIGFINSLSKTVVSIDIPSGMDANTGVGVSINAYVTLTMGMPKAGILKPEVEDKVGYVFVIDIGLPLELLKGVKGSLEYLHPSDFSGLIHRRPISSHKGDFGHILVLAGSANYTGAGALCALGALRSGCGLVTLGIPRSLQGIYQQKFLEVMTLPLPETEDLTLSQEAFPEIEKFIEKVDCIALGPGLGSHPDTIKLIKNVISSSLKPLVVDADAINAIADNLLVLRKAKSELVLTPHPGEMGRLLHTSTKGIQRDRWRITRELADKYGIVVLLKGAHSVIAGSDKKIYINSTGNPGMASGGMGDALTGIIASLIGQGFKPLTATRLGAYIHGKAGDLAAEQKGGWSITASDLLENLSGAMDSVYGR